MVIKKKKGQKSKLRPSDTKLIFNNNWVFENISEQELS